MATSAPWLPIVEERLSLVPSVAAPLLTVPSWLDKLVRYFTTLI
jgi:hypothetical protein